MSRFFKVVGLNADFYYNKVGVKHKIYPSSVNPFCFSWVEIGISTIELYKNENEFMTIKFHDEIEFGRAIDIFGDGFHG